MRLCWQKRIHSFRILQRPTPSGAGIGGAAGPASQGLAPGEAQPKRRRKAPEDIVTEGDPFNFSKWTPSDDVLLKDCIQGAPSFDKIAKTVRFSAKFSAEQIKNRWNALLYDNKTAGYFLPSHSPLPLLNQNH